jgi:hypothetical protein
MGSIGFGDISPKVWHSILTSMAAMFVSLCYRIVIFSIALVHLKIEKERSKQTSHSEARHHKTQRFSRAILILGKLKNFVIEYHVFITFLFGLFSEFFVLFDEGDGRFIFAFILCGINGLLFIILSSRVGKLYNDRDINFSDILKDYFALIFVLASAYSIMYDLYGSKVFIVPDHQNRGAVFENWATMIFFSFTLQSSTGYGNIYPSNYLTRLLVTVHVVFSDIFVIVIFGLGLNILTKRISKSFEEKVADGQSILRHD